MAIYSSCGMADQSRKYFESGASLLGREYPNIGVQRRVFKEIKQETEVTENAESTSHGNEMVPDKPVLFRDTKLNPKLLNALQKLHFITAKQVQAKALSYFSQPIWESLKICAPRKSGKTTAVLICVLNELLYDVVKKHNQTLILCSTLELAEMCYLSVQQFTEFCPLTLCLVAKGKTFDKTKKFTENIIIATPDKASEILPSLDFHKILNIFFDDADCLKNPTSQLKIFAQICKNLSPKGRIIVTTESESRFLKDFIKENTHNFFNIKVESKADNKDIKEFYVVCDNFEEKLDAIVHFTSTSNRGQTVIFCETTDVVTQLEKVLQSKSIKAVKLSGGLSATSRRNVLEQFKDKQIQILITTEAFLRVIPNDYITSVINVEQLFHKEGLLLKEYEKRKFLLKNAGTFVSFVDEKYENFFFRKKISREGGRSFYNNAEIMSVENFKNP